MTAKWSTVRRRKGAPEPGTPEHEAARTELLAELDRLESAHSGAATEPRARADAAVKWAGSPGSDPARAPRP